MTISPVLPNVNVSVSFGGDPLQSGASDLFNGSSLGTTEAAYSPTYSSTASSSGGASDSSLAKELLQTALGASSPTEKSQLIKAAIDLMGGGSGAATPAASTASSDPSSSDPTSSTSGSGSTGSSSGLSVNGNSIDTGRYTITASTSDDGSLTVYDKQTGTTDKVWGDPHVDVNGKDEADFQKDGLTLNLPDGTRIEMKPTAENSDGKAHLAEAVVSKDGQAVTMSGFTGGGGVQTSGVEQDSESLEQSAMTTDETVLDAGSDGLGDLHFTNADGSQSAALTDTGSEQDLDGSGGADPTGTTSTGGTGSNTSLAEQLLQQAESSTSSQTKDDLIQAALDLMGGTGSGASTSTGATSGATVGATDSSSTDNSSLATQLLQAAEGSTSTQTQNDLIQAAMDLMGGSSSGANGSVTSAASDLNSEIMSQVSSPTAQSQMQNDLATLLQGLAA